MARKSAYKLEAWNRRASYAKAYKKANPEKWLNAYLKRTYKIDFAQYQKMLLEQDGVCAICCGPPIRTFYCVDHNHSTGRIRGLLCHKCNAGLGMLKDSRELVEKAAGYLVKYGE